LRERFPRDTFDPKAKRGISYDEWREKGGDTLFRLAVRSGAQ
jgi:hypothetical protein